MGCLGNHNMPFWSLGSPWDPENSFGGLQDQFWLAFGAFGPSKVSTKALPFVLALPRCPRRLCLSFCIFRGVHEGSAFKGDLSILLLVPFWRVLLVHPSGRFFQNDGISLGFSKPPSSCFLLVLLSCCFHEGSGKGWPFKTKNFLTLSQVVSFCYFFLVVSS